MPLILKISFMVLLMLGSSRAVPAAELPKEVLEKIDAVVASAYQAASAKLPCKVSATGKAHMLKWQDINKCMSRAIALLNWEEFSRRLTELRPPNVAAGDFAAAVEKSLEKQSLIFEKVFQVKNAQALLPLTNPVLKYLPSDSLRGLPVFDRSGAQIGTFEDVYFFEREGGQLSGKPYRLALFQYTDTAGKLQVPAGDKLLLDSYGISWEKLKGQPGFRLPSDQLPGFSVR